MDNMAPPKGTPMKNNAVTEFLRCGKHGKSLKNL